MRVWYNGRTSAFQADDAGSIPATRSAKERKSMKKLRNMFKVDTNYQLFKINLVFAITGTISVYIAGIIINTFGLDPVVIGDFTYWVLRIMLLVPVYQVLLIMVGAVLGEFDYFWRIEKKMLGRLGIKF